MRDFASLTLEQLGGFSADCGCGERHSVTTAAVRMGAGALSELPGLLAPILPGGKVLVVTDSNVYGRCADPVIKVLADAGYTPLSHVYQAPYSTDLKSAGELFGYPEDVRAAIAVGAGSVADAVRYYASVAGIEYAVVPTAPSTDCYLASDSELCVNGIRQRFAAAPPAFVLADLDLIATAPRELAAAGFGCLASKYLAVFDWYAAYAVNGERYCDQIADLVYSALERGMAASDAIVRGEAGGIAVLTESLLRCSAASQMLPAPRLAGAAGFTARTLEMLCGHAEIPSRLRGEWEFLAAKKLTEIYRLFLEHPVYDLALPPDAGLRADVAGRLFGEGGELPQRAAEALVTPEEYELSMYRLDEYRDDLVSGLEELVPKLREANKKFKRIYEDLGYALSRSYRPEDFKAAMALAPEWGESFTLLTVLQRMGLLDNCLD